MCKFDLKLTRIHGNQLQAFRILIANSKNNHKRT